MDEPHDQPRPRSRRLNTYTAYSIACLVVWAVVWALVLAFDPRATAGHVLWVFAGWLIGWLSATFGRFVYPPPRKWRAGNPMSDSRG